MQRSSSEPLQHENEAYSNFVDSINSEQTREMYVYSLSKFLKHYEIDLDSFLSLGQQEISNHIINACEMNDVILNWKKRNS
ncbi:MAG: hypothetical protein ABR515_04080 [Nitrososphaeraceae archaeon]